MLSDSELSDFSESSNEILMLCMASTRCIALQHCITSSGHFGCTIRRPFLGAKLHNFQVLQNCQFFFKHGSNFGIVSLKCWSFKVLKNFASL